MIYSKKFMRLGELNKKYSYLQLVARSRKKKKKYSALLVNNIKKLMRLTDSYKSNGYYLCKQCKCWYYETFIIDEKDFHICLKCLLKYGLGNIYNTKKRLLSFYLERNGYWDITHIKNKIQCYLEKNKRRYVEITINDNGYFLKFNFLNDIFNYKTVDDVVSAIKRLSK